MKRIERLELEEQSKKAFGSRNYYKKLMERGRVNEFEREGKDGKPEKYLGPQRFSEDEIK